MTIYEMMERTEETIKDFHFYKKEIARLRTKLSDAGTGGVGAYGDPSSVFRAKYAVGDRTGGEVVHREREWKRLCKFEDLVRRFEEAMESLDDEKEYTMLCCLLDHQSVTEIARHLCTSRQRAHEIKSSLIQKLANVLYGGSAE